MENPEGVYFKLPVQGVIRFDILGPTGLRLLGARNTGHQSYVQDGGGERV